MKGIARWSMQDANEVAKYAVKKMFQNRELIIPGFWNRFFILLDKLMPGFLKDKLIQSQLSNSKDPEPLKRFRLADHEKHYSITATTHVSLS